MNMSLLYNKTKEILYNAYAPYSKFKVGALVVTKDGTEFTGCNIENSSYSLTCCAERVAIFKAVSEGYTDFSLLTVIAETEEVIKPCGACRQVMSEFFDETTKIFLYNINGNMQSVTINELLPDSFQL